MRFNNIDEALAHRFVGNHASDNAAFIALHRFVMDPATPRAARLAAENHALVEGMGFDPITDAELDAHLAEINSMMGA